MTPQRGFPYVLLSQVELGGEVSPLGRALVMEGHGLDPAKDDVLRDLYPQAPQA